MKNILVTGGAGYIGSHTVRKIKETGFNPVVFDNFSKGHKEAVVGFDVIEGDLSDKNLLIKVLKEKKIDAIVHFAAFIEVGESVENPAKYYRNNIVGSLNLVDSAKETGIDKVVFSSSAAIYGNPQTIPIKEDDPKLPTNPYGFTKLVIEQILHNYDKAYSIKSVSLRYFNAAGASEKGDIGEAHDPETHLIPRVIKYIQGEISDFKIFGDDYKTKDGTCIRDYIHVDDLAEAHVLALQYLERGGKTDAFNLGSEEGFSVKQVIEAIEKVSGKEISYEVGSRRKGDPDILLASSKKAKKILHWKPRYGNLDIIIKTAWGWQRKIFSQ